MPDIRLSPRERLVLTTIIELYIATGDRWHRRRWHGFCGSGGVELGNLRNVMATLGDGGLLEQPHTSSGRVPTAAAFRYYVEQITRRVARWPEPVWACRRRSDSTLSDARREQIEDSFTGVASGNEYLERTSHVLALLSSGLGVALASATAGQVLEHIHFSRL